MKLFVNCEYISKSLLSIHGILSHYEAYNMRICSRWFCDSSLVSQQHACIIILMNEAQSRPQMCSLL